MNGGNRRRIPDRHQTVSVQKRTDRRNMNFAKPSSELRRILTAIDRKGYPAYKDTKGSYQFDNYILSIDHVQGDPFAAPSRLSILIGGGKAAFPSRLYELDCMRIALQDHLLRLFSREVEQYQYKAKGSGKSGLISVSRCGQEILERSACHLHKNSGDIQLRLEAGFPANGRTINSFELTKILFDFLPRCVEATLLYARLDAAQLDAVARLAQDQESIRRQLPGLGLKAFLANGSVLPRQSGVSSRPMKDAVKFVSPKAYEVTLKVPNRGEISGMGIPSGITLIVGGGYHGKSTLLRALELGVYNHIEGDGREFVITVRDGVKIRAEDGRCIKGTDISLFINDLPNKKDTCSFATEDASGSTSQAANVCEAVEAGATLLLIDEDTSATNFMIRDELMQRVVSRNQEPITPFIERVRMLYEKHGISSVIVAGSSGAYFHIADHIIQMDQYVPKDITSFAKEAASDFPPLTMPEGNTSLPEFKRILKPAGELKNAENGRCKCKSFGTDTLQIQRMTIDLRYLEQLTDQEQTNALGYILIYATKHCLDGKKNLIQVIDEIEAMVKQGGLAVLAEGGYLPAGLAMPRRQEIFACFNRYRV